MTNTEDSASAPSQRLAGRVALITGGSRGQGAAHALRLATEGAVVYIADVLDDEGDRAAKKLRDKGLDVSYVHLDVTDPANWQSVRDVVETKFGLLDILVNNAGIVHVTDLVDETLEEWNRLLAVNLTGAFLGLRTMIPLLRASTSGAVVNTSSIFGPSGAVGYAAYAASKAGMLGLTRTAALELAADGIRVNALVPGGVSTPLNAKEPGQGVVPETPMKRRADPAELAGRWPTSSATMPASSPARNWSSTAVSALAEPIPQYRNIRLLHEPNTCLSRWTGYHSHRPPADTDRWGRTQRTEQAPTAACRETTSHAIGCES